MNTLYETMIQNITIAYQPIIDLKNGHVNGEEAFMRSGTQESPLTLLAAVRAMNKIPDFDSDIHSMALKGHIHASAKKRVFLNTELLTFCSNRNHLDALNVLIHELGLRPKDVVLELCEREYDVNDDKLTAALARYQSLALWSPTPHFPRAAFEQLRRAMTTAGILTGAPSFEDCVDEAIVTRALGG